MVRTGAIIGALAVAAALPGHAVAQDGERWLLAAEGSATIAITDPQRSLFGPGATASMALFRSLSTWLLLGLRAQALIVSDKSAPPADLALAEPDAGGLYFLSPVLRLRPLGGAQERATGLFLEGGGGPGLTGNRIRGAVHGALGYGFDAGRVTISPSARYIHVIETVGPSRDDARFVALGLELTFLDENRPERRPWPVHETEPIVVARVEPPPVEPREPAVDVPKEPEVPADTDGDGVVDAEDECPTEAETSNGINDDDGCPDSGAMEPVNGRVVVDDTILFATGRSRLNREGRQLIRDLAERWKANPEWVGLRVEGHADIRGSRRYNLRLSRRRAHAVRRALIAYGVQAGSIETVGFGEARPRDTGQTEVAHRKNRRVEFVVVRREEAGVPAGEKSK